MFLSILFTLLKELLPGVPLAAITTVASTPCGHTLLTYSLRKLHKKNQMVH